MKGQSDAPEGRRVRSGWNRDGPWMGVNKQGSPRVRERAHGATSHGSIRGRTGGSSFRQSLLPAVERRRESEERAEADRHEQRAEDRYHGSQSQAPL